MNKGFTIDSAGNYRVSTYTGYLAALDHQWHRLRADTYARKAWEIECKRKNVRADDAAWKIHKGKP